MSQDTTSFQTSTSYSRDIGIGAAIAIVTALGGGYVCAKVIHGFGEMGVMLLLLLGWLAGSAARKLMTRPRKVVGYLIGGAVVLAMLIAEVAWIRWNIKDVESWGKAISLLPTFCQQYSMSAIIAVVCSIFGASSAYREAGVRYRIVQVVED